MRKGVMESSKGKTHIKNGRKFLFSVLVLLIILVIVILIILNIMNKKEPIDENTNISSLNANKYSQELAKLYNMTEAKENFLADYDVIQSGVALYIMNNSTMEENSFINLVAKLKSELEKDDWKNLNLEKPTNWNGKWSVDNDGVLKFRFEIKEIEPNWINDSDILVKVIKN